MEAIYSRLVKQVSFVSSTRRLAQTLEQFIPHKKILEIGSGCGAITRWLGELGADVTAIEGSERRANITYSRCRDLDNIKFFCEGFDAFYENEKFDLVLLIGVLEYSNLFIRADKPALALLTKAKQLLKEDGLLVIAIENKLGLKYWAGAPEDPETKLST